MLLIKSWILIYLDWGSSCATVEWHKVFPEDSKASKAWSWDVCLSGCAAVLSGNSEIGIDLFPSGGVDASHGLVGGVVEIVSEFGCSGFVGECGDDILETG